MHQLLRQRIVHQISAALALSRELRALGHHQGRGRFRELLVQDLVKPLIPPAWEVMTGFLVDHTGKQAASESGQEDILIYSPDLLPGSFRLSEIGILPIEACLAVIEVKSQLRMDSVRDSIRHAQRVTELSTIYDKLKKVPSNWAGQMIRRPLYTLFALESDLSAGMAAELERVRGAHLEQKLDRSLLFAICCCEISCAAWYGEKQTLAATRTQGSDGKNGETVAFFSFLSDYARMIHRLRSSSLPMLALSHYLLPATPKEAHPRTAGDR